jgi:hypothetical protein
LPTPWCPVKEVRTFTIGQQPTTPCQLHKEPVVAICDETGKLASVSCPATHEVPVSEKPTDFYCLRHARNPLARPWLILAWLDGQSKAHRMTDEQLEYGTHVVGQAGVRYVRIFYPGWLDGLDCVLPYEREADGRFNLDKPNPKYDENLKRLAVALQRHEVGLIVDMADQCGWDSEWDCWRRNCNGVYGWQDESAVALVYWKRAVDRVLTDIGGMEGNQIGLGNELRHIADGDLVGSCTWALEWAGKRVDYLVSLGQVRPILFSACCNTAHKIIGCVSSEDGYYPDNRYVAQVIHGIGIDSHQPDGKPLGEWLAGLSVTRPFGRSTDGVDTSGWNHVPPEKAGTCDQCGGCSGNIEETIKVDQLFERFIDEGRYVAIEYLPREISFNEPLSAIQQLSLDMFWRTALEIYGVDVRRAFPDSVLPIVVSEEVKPKPLKPGPNPKLTPR